MFMNYFCFFPVNALQGGQAQNAVLNGQNGIHDSELNKVNNDQKLSNQGVASVTKAPKRRKRKKHRNVSVPKENIPNAGVRAPNPADIKDPVFNVQDIVKKAKEDSLKETTQNRGVPQVKMIQDVQQNKVEGIPVQAFTADQKAKNVVVGGDINNQNVVKEGNQAANQINGLQSQDSQNNAKVPAANANSYDQVANNLNNVHQEVVRGNVETNNQNQQQYNNNANNNNANNNVNNANFQVNNNNNFNNANNNNLNNMNNNNNNGFVQPAVNAESQRPGMKDSLKIVWDWSDFLINYETYVMPEQKNRRAPQATTGEPWPMPQYYVAKANKVYRIDKDKFRFNIVKESCDIIERAVERYRDMIIEDTIMDMYNNLQHAQGTSIRDVSLKYNDDIYVKAEAVQVVNIKIRRPCTKFPNDQMDESCEYIMVTFCCRTV